MYVSKLRFERVNNGFDLKWTQEDNGVFSDCSTLVKTKDELEEKVNDLVKHVKF